MYFAVLLINNDTIFNIIHLKISLDTLSDKIASIMVSFVSFYLSVSLYFSAVCFCIKINTDHANWSLFTTPFNTFHTDLAPPPCALNITKISRSRLHSSKVFSFVFFCLSFLSQTFTINRTARGGNEAFSLMPFDHFHSLYSYVGITWAITVESSPMHKSLTIKLRVLKARTYWEVVLHRNVPLKTL